MVIGFRHAQYATHLLNFFFELNSIWSILHEKIDSLKPTMYQSHTAHSA